MESLLNETDLSPIKFALSCYLNQYPWDPLMALLGAITTRACRHHYLVQHCPKRPMLLYLARLVNGDVRAAAAA